MLTTSAVISWLCEIGGADGTGTGCIATVPLNPFDADVLLDGDDMPSALSLCWAIISLVFPLEAADPDPPQLSAEDEEADRVLPEPGN